MALGELERVGVVASAQTPLRPSWPRLQHIDLIGRAVESALRGSGLRMQDIDVVIDCGSDVLDGRSISNCGFLGAMGGHHKEESRVEEDGLFGAVYAVNKVACGSASVALVVAYSKPSESDVSAYWSTLAEPFYQRPVGVDHLVAAGLAASHYLAATAATEDDLVRIAARSWRRAADNVAVESDTWPDVDNIRNAETVAAPLTRHQVARPVDGAVAVLLARESVARRATDTPVWVTGMGASMDSQFLSERAPGELSSMRAAGAMALRRAGIDDVSSIDIAEIAATSAAAEAMAVEALGFAPRGRGVDCYRDGAEVDINPSGGAVPADPIMATGLVRLHEAASRLTTRSGGPTRALVSGSGGLAMQNSCVFTLEV